MLCYLANTGQVLLNSSTWDCNLKRRIRGPSFRRSLATCSSSSTRTRRDFNDSGSQFFICVADASGLDRRYTVFGEVYRGVEVLDKIVALPRDERDNPLEPVDMTITVKE